MIRLSTPSLSRVPPVARRSNAVVPFAAIALLGLILAAMPIGAAQAVYTSQGGSCNHTSTSTVAIDVNGPTTWRCTDNDNNTVDGAGPTWTSQGQSCNDSDSGAVGLRLTLDSSHRCSDNDTTTITNSFGSNDIQQ